jgi:hypothetical protein
MNGAFGPSGYSAPIPGLELVAKDLDQAFESSFMCASGLRKPQFRLLQAGVLITNCLQVYDD